MTPPEKFSPVVALGIDGVLTAPSTGPHLFPRLEVHEVNLPRLPGTHLTPAPGEADGPTEPQWSALHMFVDAGVAWLKDLVTRGTEVVWATNGLAEANDEIAPARWRPPLPTAVVSGNEAYENPSDWKSTHLARQFDGRPLLWVDARLPSASFRLEHLRRKTDRVITKFRWVPDAHGITDGDVRVMDEWLFMAATEEGQNELRRRRRRDQARRRRRDFGTERNYRAWTAALRSAEQILGSSHSLVIPLTEILVEADELDEVQVRTLGRALRGHSSLSADLLPKILQHRPHSGA